MILRQICGGTVFGLLCALTLTTNNVMAQTQTGAVEQNQAQTAPPASPAPAPISNQAAVQATDGRYVPADGTIDGSNLKQFLNSGPAVNSTQMEEASIPADNMMQMPARVDNKADARAQAAAQQGQTTTTNPHNKQQKQHTFFGAIARPFVSTLNFMGFPVGLNNDVGIDASLSSDLPESVRKRDGAYNPNVAPGVEATTNKTFGQ